MKNLFSVCDVLVIVLIASELVNRGPMAEGHIPLPPRDVSALNKVVDEQLTKSSEITTEDASEG
ncbi:hypothetical protein ACP70R_037112 [Stipagrostis hirtigluma subsp. patula]